MQNIGIDAINSDDIKMKLKHSDTIKDHLGSVYDTIPYFEGLPYMDYEDRELTWGNIFKGLFAPYNNKWKEFIIHELEKKPWIKIKGFGNTTSNVRQKVNKVLTRMSTLMRSEQSMKITPAELLEVDLLNNRHRLINHISKNL